MNTFVHGEFYERNSGVDARMHVVLQPECNLHNVYDYMQAAYNRLQAACIRSVNPALGADPSFASIDRHWKQYFLRCSIITPLPVGYT